MSVVQCANGHYYNPEVHSVCPYCTEEFGYPPFAGDDPTGDDPRGRGGFDYPPDTIPTPSQLPPPDNIPMPPQPYKGDRNKTAKYPTEPVKPDQSGEEEEPETDVGGMGATRAFLLKGTDPVVGWLVCVSGSNYGLSFPLHRGKNFIGRDALKNDIGLYGDISVSRVKHAMVIYDPRTRLFFAQSGDESHQLFYLNDQAVLSDLQLNDRDVLRIGRTTLVFVPFCDEQFGWNEEEQEE